MSKAENSQWSNEYGYNSEPEMELLAISPERLTVDLSVFTEEDWITLGRLDASNAGTLNMFDFSSYSKYLDILLPGNWNPQATKLVNDGILPTEILIIRESLLSISKRYSNTISIESIDPDSSPENLRDKAIFLLSLEIMSTCIYCVSDEGLCAFEFEKGRPPKLYDLEKNLKQLKSLYSQYFTNSRPTVAIEYALEKYKLYKDGVEAQQDLLETLTEGDQMRQERNKCIYEYQRLANGYQTIISALQS